MANVLLKYLQIWRMKTPKQKWLFLYKCLAIISDSIGVTVYSTLKIYWYSFFSEVMGTLYFATAAYTVWFYFERGEYLRGLQATCAVGIVVTCLIVQIQMISSTRFIHNNLVNIGGKYIYMDEDQASKYDVVREQLIAKLVRDIVVVCILMFTAMGMFGLPPLYAVVFKRERVTLLGMELPFFEKDSDVGFVLNWTMQATISVLGLTGIVGIEIGQNMLHHVVYSMPHLVHVDTEELGSELKANGMSVMAKAQLRNIFMKVQDFESFVNESIELYYMRCFVGPFLFTYSISISIFGQYFLGYPAGYGCAAGNYLLLLICCHLGENMEEAKEHIISELYNMSWYSLPPSSQRGIGSAIHMIQNGGSLTIGPFSILNMETASDLTKSIYRFTMLLYRALT